MDVRTVCQSLGEEYELSEHLKNFTYLAKLARRKFIDEVFINKSRPPLFRPIPITKKEAETQESEENMSKAEILLKIGTLLEQLGENVQKKYSGLRSKKRSELLSILKDIKYIFNSDNGVDNDSCLESSGA